MTRDQALQLGQPKREDCGRRQARVNLKLPPVRASVVERPDQQMDAAVSMKSSPERSTRTGRFSARNRSKRYFKTGAEAMSSSPSRRRRGLAILHLTPRSTAASFRLTKAAARVIGLSQLPAATGFHNCPRRDVHLQQAAVNRTLLLRATTSGLSADVTPLDLPGGSEVNAGSAAATDQALSNSVATPGQAAMPDEAVGACSRAGWAGPANPVPTQLGRRNAQRDSQRSRHRPAAFAQIQACAARARHDCFCSRARLGRAIAKATTR